MKECNKRFVFICADQETKKIAFLRLVFPQISTEFIRFIMKECNKRFVFICADQWTKNIAFLRLVFPQIYVEIF